MFDFLNLNSNTPEPTNNDLIDLTVEGNNTNSKEEIDDDNDDDVLTPSLNFNAKNAIDSQQKQTHTIEIGTLVQSQWQDDDSLLTTILAPKLWKSRENNYRIKTDTLNNFKENIVTKLFGTSGITWNTQLIEQKNNQSTIVTDTSNLKFEYQHKYLMNHFAMGKLSLINNCM